MGKPLAVGATAPPFDAMDGAGKRWTSDELKGRVFVLYFYPKDQTPGCTAQACSFRDEWSDYEAEGIPVFGVSRDGASSHKAFADRYRLPFPLLADAGGAMHQAYGATMFGGLPRRVTYLVDAEARIAGVYNSRLRPGSHASHMLEAARALKQKK